ncbi:MAG: glycosyltransferase family 2 protein [Ginsengibacter sp.]
METLSLCIPAYNAEWCLPRLLRSAKMQKIPFSEVLVYDDCSTDNTAIVSKKFGATVIRADRNVGCSAAKNELAKIASGNWLFFIDADDELYPEFSEVAGEWMKKNNPADVILMRYRYINFSTQEILEEPYYDPGELKKDPVRFTIRHKIVNFELLKRIPFLKAGGFDLDPNILYNEDRAFIVRAALSGLNFDADTRIIGAKYYFPESMSAQAPQRWIKASTELWRKSYKKIGKEYLPDVCEQLYENAVWAAKSGHWDLVKRSLTLAHEIQPGAAPASTILFKVAFRLFPFGAYYLREHILRVKRKLAN